MRWASLMLVIASCSSPSAVAPIELDLTFPGDRLDPHEYTSVEVRVHGEQELDRVAAIVDGRFDLGGIEAMTATSVEAVLRDDSGAMKGYGRVSTSVELGPGTRISMPVRRPLVYAAGLVQTDGDGNPSTNDFRWTHVPATRVDLSDSAPLDGSTRVGQDAVATVAAGPRLFVIHQATLDPTGAFTGPAMIDEIVGSDPPMSIPLSVSLDGAIADAAGSDDGRTLLVATSTALYAIDVETSNLMTIAQGNFARVALSMADDAVTGLAIADRIADSGACASTAHLYSISGALSTGFQVRELAPAGYADVAAWTGRTFYVDACAGTLGEVIGDTPTPLLTSLGRPTTLAVAGNGAWVGVETLASNGPPSLSVLNVPLASSAAPRAVFSHPTTQFVQATQYPDVKRSVTATSARFSGLELGGGGDFIAFASAVSYSGEAIVEANIPKMNIDTDELWVLDTASGAIVRWYRSWCDGTIVITAGDISNWNCATSTGQSAPQTGFEHRIRSLAVIFGLR
jgi:hypothetical protein